MAKDIKQIKKTVDELIDVEIASEFISLYIFF